MIARGCAQIEHQRKAHFGQHLCSMFEHLQDLMGPGLVYTLTPCCSLESMYKEVTDQCGQNISLIQAQTHGGNPTSEGSWLKYAEQRVGVDKSSWFVDTHGSGQINGGKKGLWKTVKDWHKKHEGAPGMTTWTAETSYKCKPPFCAEAIAHTAQRYDDPDQFPDLFTCKCG